MTEQVQSARKRKILIILAACIKTVYTLTPVLEFVLTLGAESRLSDSSTRCIRFKDKMARNVHMLVS